MKARCFFVAVMLVAVMLVIGVGAEGVPQEKSWVGESVIYTKEPKDIKFTDRIDGLDVTFPFYGVTPIKVLAERDGKLRVHDGRRVGWAAKADFVLVSEAPVFFHRLVGAN